MHENQTIVNWTIDYDKKYEKEIARLRKQHPNRYEKMHEFLTLNPDVSVGGHRVFPLTGDDCRGAWEYKVSVSKQTFRVFYMLDTANRKVRIYYAGPKPNKVPLPPSKLSSLFIDETSSSDDNHRSAGKKDKIQRR
jgi:mRNA-degrading endonuclease RelE of RelBE toxin-antitoxin system